MTVEPETGPKYRQIAAWLRTKITRGELRPGQTVPTEKELSDKYGVSRNTVRLALGALTNEGLITGGRGRGRVVRKMEPLVYYAHRRRSDELDGVSSTDAFLQQVKSQGHETVQQIEVSIVLANADMAKALEVNVGENVVVRRRLQIIDGQAWSTSDSYYPLEVVQGSAIMSPASIPQGVRKLLADMGFEQTHYVDELTVRMPRPPEANRLDIGPGIPVMVHERIGMTANGPVRWTRTIFPGDRHSIVYEVPA
ncbi:GntR family transcriptional regulator [Fodinicola acaciae]|uniref:GntR family transcriptional regulator n=1 Tax=Fodinicola acaciae TaxID=2681555 RepID=UPI0013D02469|nr:GntR family transcriptional regulator [Fodinicola acaciae]